MMAYKILFDANDSKHIHVVGLGDYVPVAEAQALAAQVEALREVISERFTRKELQPDGTIITDGAPWALQLLAATPQQHLAEIRAEAVVSFLSQFEGKTYWNKSINDFVSEGYQYAASIRQGGIK